MGFRLKKNRPMGHPKPGWAGLGRVKPSPFGALFGGFCGLAKKMHEKQADKLSSLYKQLALILWIR